MAIVVKIKPKKMTAKSKQQVLRNIIDYSNWDFCYSSGPVKGHAIISKDRKMVRLYNIHKFNRKTREDVKTITRGKNKGQVVKTRTVIRESHWIAYYYDVPMNMIASAKQNIRNFEIKMR